jgi:predicted phosphoribosyltransferase
LEDEIGSQVAEIERRERIYRGGRPRTSLARLVAIVVDDGIATGGTAIAALRWTRAQRPARVVLAVPVAPRSIVSRLGEEADEVVVLDTPEPFLAVGEWYRDFEQTSDDEVIALLAELAGSSV